MDGRLARERTSVLGTLSSHEMPSMRRRQRIWKELSLLSCLAYVVHVSLPYIKVLTTQSLIFYTAILVLMVSLGFSHTLEVRRARVVAALPILLSISASSEMLLLMVEPK